MPTTSDLEPTPPPSYSQSWQDRVQLPNQGFADEDEHPRAPYSDREIAPLLLEGHQDEDEDFRKKAKVRAPRIFWLGFSIAIIITTVIGYVYYRNWRELKQEKARRYWSDILADDQCLAHDRIHYRALLTDVSSTFDVLEACRTTPITINDIKYQSPDRCEDVGNRNVYGHWIVRNELKCASYWAYFKDKGCTSRGSGLRRFEAPIAGVTTGQDAAKLCHTTPATILNQTLEHPMACPDWGKHGFWGIWDVPDARCK